MEIPIVVLGAVALLVVTVIAQWLLPYTGLAAAKEYREALRPAGLALLGFAAGVALFYVASIVFSFLLPRNECLVKAPMGRSCMLQSQALLQLGFGLVGAVVAVRVDWDSEKHRTLDSSAWRILAIVLIIGAVAGIAVAILDCQQLGIFCTRSEDIPGCNLLLLAFFGIIGYAYLSGREKTADS